MLAVLIVTRLGYLVLGLTFDASPADTYLQFVPREWLDDSLLTSIYYSHASPPFLNVVTGIGVKLFGNSAWVFYALIWHAMGFGLLFSTFYVSTRLMGNLPAWLITGLIAISPAFHLYQNWLMYTFPAACFLMISAALLVRLIDNPSRAVAGWFFISLALLVLTRSIFQIYWMLLVTAILVAVMPGFRKNLCYAAALPLLVCALWYGKNYYLYNSFSASTLLGLSLNNVTTLTLPKQALAPLVERGELSRFAVISRYTELGDVLATESLAEKTGLSLLDDERTPTGQLNYNSLEMLVASRLYLHDSLTVLDRFPLNYSIAMLLSHQVYFSPTSMNRYFSDSNLSATEPIAGIFNRIAHGSGDTYDIQQLHFGFSGSNRIAVSPGLLLIVTSLLIFATGTTRAVNIVLERDWRTETIVFGYLFGNWLMIYLVGTYAELYENNRYRFIAEPVYWVLLALMIREFVLRYRSAKTANPA